MRMIIPALPDSCMPIERDSLGREIIPWDNPEFQTAAINASTEPGGVLYPGVTLTAEELDFVDGLYDAIGLDSSGQAKVTTALASLDRGPTSTHAYRWSKYRLPENENNAWRAEIARNSLLNIQYINQAGRSQWSTHPGHKGAVQRDRPRQR